jgi:hypothetical protein
VVEVIPKRQPEGTSNHCMLEKSCLKALRFLKRKCCDIGFHVSAQPMARVKPLEIGKRTLVLISGISTTATEGVVLSEAASMATGKCGFGFRRYKKVWRAYATRAQAHRLELNLQSLACKMQRSDC